MQNPTRHDPNLRVLYYDDAIVKFRNARQLALKLGIRPAAVYQWKGVVPWNRMEQVQALLDECRKPRKRSAGVVK
jgi:uncharacterized protein YjcR